MEIKIQRSIRISQAYKGGSFHFLYRRVSLKCSRIAAFSQRSVPSDNVQSSCQDKQEEKDGCFSAVSPEGWVGRRKHCHSLLMGTCTGETARRARLRAVGLQPALLPTTKMPIGCQSAGSGCLCPVSRASPPE